MVNGFYYEKDYKLLMKQMIDRLTSKKSERVYNVEKAFLLAQELHAGQFRHSGDPYILHPVIVATILEKLDFDTNVISAALLHDVVEDCNYTVEQIKTEFNSTISEIVDAVTAISKNQYEQELDSIFDNSEFLKMSLEGKTYHKLMKIGKKNRFAFYIKFADRLHNLKTIASVQEYRKLEKVKETEKWILPLCDILKSSFFFNAIKNECFKIVNEKKITYFEEEYKRLIENNQKNIEDLHEKLFNYISNIASQKDTKSHLYKIIFSYQTEEQIYNNIVNDLAIKGLQNIRASHMVKVPVCDIYVLLNNDITNKENDIMFSFLEDKKVKSLFKIIGFTQDEKFNMPYYVVKDAKNNIYRICTTTINNYIAFTNGSTEGSGLELINEENLGEIETEYIKVKTRSNEVIEIPSGSTVLDFAFKIHNDIGFSFKYATINESPSKFPHYTKLKDGDKINIITQKNENGETQETAQIRWLAYVKTETAKKALIRYFEKKYDKYN